MEPALSQSEIDRALEAVAQARKRGILYKTPLVRLNHDVPGVDVWLKLESLQPIGSFKVRGAAAVAHVTGNSALIRAGGLWTVSAGNMAQAVAYIAREMQCECVCVVPHGAPRTKLDAVERLGGRLISVPYEEWWATLEQGTDSAVAKAHRLTGLFVHPVADPHVVAGNASVGMEIFEDLDHVDEIYVPYGGGALSTGVAAAAQMRTNGQCRVYGCEPDTACPATESFRTGKRCSDFVHWEPTFVDGCGSKSVLESMWPLASQLLAGAVAVPPKAAAAAVKLMLERNRVVAEGASGCAVAAALSSAVHVSYESKRRCVVCVVSGGGLDTAKLVQILADCPQAAAAGTSLSLRCPHATGNAHGWVREALGFVVGCAVTLAILRQHPGSKTL